MPPREIAHHFAQAGAVHREIAGGGWLHLKPGQVTDDTGMALALGEAILAHDGKVSSLACARAFDAWMRRKPVDIGNTVRRKFCPTCGSHLFADSSGRVGLTVVRTGTLDDPSAIRPVANIWSASAPAWACLDASLERIEHQPLPPKPGVT